MLLKPGDKVSFLNEKRDGIVKKILNNKMVLVEIEDGFNIPVLEHDLVKAQSFEDRITNNQPTAGSMTTPAIEEEEEDVRFPERIQLLAADEDQNKTRRGFYIAFIPEDPDHVLFSGFGIYLVNHHGQDVLFTYSLKEHDQFICKDFDRVDEESAILLDTIDKTDIEKWKEIRFQFLFFKQGAAINKPPVVHEVRVKPVRFYKEDNYSLFSLLDEKCMLISLSSEKEKAEPEEWPEEKWENIKVEKPVGIKVVGHIRDYFRIEPIPEKHILESRVAEVDLHIEELIDNISGKDNFELLTIQLNYFSKMLESAIANKFMKIIFIHGVGNGKLKQEIIDKLIADYPGLNYNDASLLKYGRGATEVILDNKEII